MKKFYLSMLTVLTILVSTTVLAEVTGRGDSEGEARADAKSTARTVCRDYVNYSKAVNFEIDCYPKGSRWECVAEYDCE